MRDLAGAMAIMEGYEGLSGKGDDGKFYPVQEEADKSGVYTIGKGHVVSPKEMVKFSKGLTLKEVGDLFASDVSSRIKRLDKYANGATDRQYGALLSMFYNNEDSIVKGSPGKYHRVGNFRYAAASLLMYVISDGKPRKGLWRRRMTEAYYYMTGVVKIANTPQTEKSLFLDIEDLGLIDILRELKPDHPFLPKEDKGLKLLYGKSFYASKLQKFLVELGYTLKIDGIAGNNTSDAFKDASGYYLKGDPRDGR